MIDNIVLLISGTLHERDTHDLLERCHPLGWFETMPALCVATNVEELFNTVLVETPLGALVSWLCRPSPRHTDLVTGPQHPTSATASLRKTSTSSTSRSSATRCANL